MTRALILLYLESPQEALRDVNEVYGLPQGDSRASELAARIRRQIADDELAGKAPSGPFVKRSFATSRQPATPTQEIMEAERSGQTAPLPAGSPCQSDQS